MEDHPSKQPVRVLFTGAEAAPLVKVGGLGDVTGSLPQALLALPEALRAGRELDIRLALPYHPQIPRNVPEIRSVTQFTVYHPRGAVQAEAFLTHAGDLPVYLIDGELIPRSGSVYSLDTQKDGEKFTFFSLALLELTRALDWPIDILHANDWHTALSTVILAQRRSKERFFARTRSLLTVHNLPYMGAGTDQAMKAFGVRPLRDPRLPPWGNFQPLPMGMAMADFITTVSPTYGREILTPDFGCGLEAFLRTRVDSIQGILNGLDTVAWDPAIDPALARNFTAQTLSDRLANKQALASEFGLNPDPEVPLMVLVSRMDYQKGIDLVANALRQVAQDETGCGSQAWQAILLGNGDPAIEKECRDLEAEFPQRVRAAIRFDTSLSRRMYAGGDMLLMPSRYEPCGLAQMIAMRYGCLPVAHATGGLRDTIFDSQEPERSTGFLYEESSAEALASAICRGLTAFQNRNSWEARQRYAMAQDFSWERSAAAYFRIYLSLMEAAL